MARCCPKCFSSDIDYDGASGESVCTNCGHVLEEGAIVSEVQFMEGSGGQSSVVGQFVPDSGLTYGSGRGFGRDNRDSREITLANGKRIIQHLSGLLRLNNNQGEVAHRFFQQAVQRNFTQGRRTQSVIAVCLYIVCRKQKTSHMLIDFAEALQVDVYELGSVFLKFCKILHIRLDPIDPSLFIHRFAALLEFGDRTQQVSLTALRLVARMNRDWMISGRRPAGICGAGLCIAAKMHRFHRTSAQVAQVVRICDGTLRRRLDEFEETDASDMTIEQFQALFKGPTSAEFVEGEALRERRAGEWTWDEARAPPAFKENRRKEAELTVLLARKRKRLAAQGNGEEEGGSAAAAGEGLDGAVLDDLEDGALQRHMAAALSSRALRDLDIDADTATLIRKDLTPLQAGANPTTPARAHLQPTKLPAAHSRPTEMESPAKAHSGRSKGWEEEEDVNLSDVDDEEINGYIRSEADAANRAVVWDELNRDYLEKQAEKKRLQELMPDDSEAKKKKKKRKVDGENQGNSATALEAATKMLRQRNLSNKVNHAVLQNLFGDADGADV